MKFKFDANQEFQIHAIEAITDLFNGQERFSGRIEFTQDGLAAVSNRLDLDEKTLLENLRGIQLRNNIKMDPALQYIEESIQTIKGKIICRFPNFSVEMETGTGKTYVYLRIICELNQRYGMRKFIIVVPSIAIREGVLKTLKITEEHFKIHYGNPIFRYYVYDSSNLTQVRQFALSDSMEIMVMTIDSFNKSAKNVIHQSTDRLQGETPIHLVQAARPILILDEPQNMESEKSVAALAVLYPLFALRFSATHRNPYNLVYRLTPAEAYRQGLVKKIEVASVVQELDVNRPFARVMAIESKKQTITAKLVVHKLMKTGVVKEAEIIIRSGDSLEEKTGRRDYAGYEIEEINPGGKYIRFANNVEMRVGEEMGSDKEEIFKAQIEYTIEEHFRKQRRLKDRGIKVLSLFFIDRVANYIDETGQPGLIRKMFDQMFESLREKFPEWRNLKPEQVQAAYFAQKRRKGGEVEMLDSKTGESSDDAAAYDLIMKNKEALLGFPEPEDDEETRGSKQVSFIFSHSALREGWDNPNVFQICTLNQTASLMKKRQEVGRGVRLAVNQKGDRVFEDRVNILTVIANESYKDYVSKIQDEIIEEYGKENLPPPPRKARERKARLRKARLLRDDFKELWNRIRQKTRYSVKIDTQKILDDVLPELEKAPVEKPKVTITRAAIDISDEGIWEAMQTSAAKTAADLSGRYPLPNLVEIIENLLEHTSPPVRLTRKTLLSLFCRLRNNKPAIDNPHEWASVATRILKEKLADHLINGIQYEKIEDWYNMSQILDEDEIELFCRFIGEPDESKDKTIYDLIPCDSDIEESFVKQLEARQDIKLYIKLPHWFKVATPIGDYNPAWAIVMEDDNNEGKPVLYLVAETMGSIAEGELRFGENRKIRCGAKHFGSKQFGEKGALEGVDYKVVSNADEL